MDILPRKLYYEIEKTLEQVSELIVDSLPTCIVSDEDVLCFGAGCPVRVKMESTSSSLNYQELEGKILFGKVMPCGSWSYTVMLFHDKEKKCFKIEEHVTQERIKYRTISQVDCNQGGSPQDDSKTPTNANDELASCRSTKPTRPDHDHKSNSNKLSGQKRLMKGVSDSVGGQPIVDGGDSDISRNSKKPSQHVLTYNVVALKARIWSHPIVVTTQSNTAEETSW